MVSLAFGDPALTFTLFFSTMFLLVILIIGVAIMRGPALTFLIAKLRSKSVLIIVGRDRMCKVQPANYRQGSVYAPNSGYYGVSSGSTYVDRQSRVPIQFAYDQLAMTLDPKMVQAMNELKKYEIPYHVKRVNRKGEEIYIEKNKIENTVDLQEFILFVDDHRNAIEYDSFDEQTMTVHLNECGPCQLINLGIKLPYETVDLQSIPNWINKTISPSFLDGIIVNEVKMKLLQQQKLDPKWLILLPAVIIASGVALLIMSQLAATPPPIPEINVIGE